MAGKPRQLTGQEVLDDLKYVINDRGKKLTGKKRKKTVSVPRRRN